MSRRELKFPPYEFLESLPKEHLVTNYMGRCDISPEMKPVEHKFTLFRTPANVYARFTLNENGNGLIIFDLMEGGYSEANEFGMQLKFNRANYDEICRHAQKVYDKFFEELETDLSFQWAE